MAIYLIRHTTPIITQEYCYGHMDIDVADDFELLAVSVESKLQNWHPEIVYSSPLIRCAKLAKRLFPANNILFNDKLKEMNFGDWEGAKWSDIHKESLMMWTQNFETQAVPNGESLQIFNCRVLEFWHSIDVMRDAAIVAHAGTMRMILSKALGIPLNKSFSIAMKYAQVIKLSPWDSENIQVEFL